MIRNILCAILLFVVCAVAVPKVAHAADITAGVTCSGAAANSAVCKSKTDQNPLTGSNGLLIHISNIIAYIAGAAAIIVIIVGGIKFVTAGGDSNNAASARTTVLNALIGLVVIILARQLIVFVISRL